MGQQLNQDVAMFLFDHMPVGVLLVDQYNQVYWVNQVLQAYIGVATPRLVGCPVDGLNIQCVEPSENLYTIKNYKDNSLRWLSNVATLPLTSQGQALTARYFIDVSESMQRQQALQDQLKGLAREDILTGFFNKKAILSILGSQISRSRRYQNPLSILLLGLCSATTLKGDSMPVDDSLIKSLSWYLKDQLRWVDLIGRLDERSFVMILPETSKISALRLQDKITQAFLELPMLGDSANLICVNCGFGAAEWQKGDDANLLMDKAQRHLLENQSN